MATPLSAIARPAPMSTPWPSGAWVAWSDGLPRGALVSSVGFESAVGWVSGLVSLPVAGFFPASSSSPPSYVQSGLALDAPLLASRRQAMSTALPLLTYVSASVVKKCDDASCIVQHLPPAVPQPDVSLKPTHTSPATAHARRQRCRKTSSLSAASL